MQVRQILLKHYNSLLLGIHLESPHHLLILTGTSEAKISFSYRRDGRKLENTCTVQGNAVVNFQRMAKRNVRLQYFWVY